MNGFGLRREEVSFTRLEYGGGIGGHDILKQYATDLSIRYSYQILNAAEVPGIVARGGRHQYSGRRYHLGSQA